MNTQIAFGRMHPQWNQMCRAFSGDLMHGYYAEANLQIIKEQFIDRVSNLIDIAYQPVVTSRDELRDQLAAMSAVKRVVFRKDGMSVYLHDITCKPSCGNVDRVQSEFRSHSKNTDVNVIIPGLILGIKWDIRDTNTYFSYSLNVAKDVGQKHRGYCGRNLAHPHWISRNAPCLGDFEQSISDAKHNLDIPLQITILIMYLEQYNYRDCAGAYMHNWAPDRQLLPNPFAELEDARSLRDSAFALDFDPRYVVPYKDTLKAYKWLLAQADQDVASFNNPWCREVPNILENLGALALHIKNEFETDLMAKRIIKLAYVSTWSNNEALNLAYYEKRMDAAASVGSFIKSINIKYDYRLYFATTYGRIDNADHEYYLEQHNVTIFDYYYCPANDGAIIILQDKNNNIKQPPIQFAQYVEMGSQSLESFYKLQTATAENHTFANEIMSKILHARSQGFCNDTALQILTNEITTNYPHEDSDDE